MISTSINYQLQYSVEKPDDAINSHLKHFVILAW